MSQPRYKTVISPLGERRTVEIDAHGNEIRVVKRGGILGGLFRGSDPGGAAPAPGRHPGTAPARPITVGARHEAKLGEVGRAAAPRVLPRPRDPELDSELEAMHSEIARLNARVGELEYEVSVLRGEAPSAPATTPAPTRVDFGDASPANIAPATSPDDQDAAPSVFFEVPPPPPSDVPWFAQPSEPDPIREEPDVRPPEL